MATLKQIETRHRNHAILRLKGMAAATNQSYRLADGGIRVIFTKDEYRDIIKIINAALKRLNADPVEDIYA